jgi:hypothetical protein
MRPDSYHRAGVRSRSAVTCWSTGEGRWICAPIGLVVSSGGICPHGEDCLGSDRGPDRALLPGMACGASSTLARRMTTESWRHLRPRLGRVNSTSAWPSALPSAARWRSPRPSRMGICGTPCAVLMTRSAPARPQGRCGVPAARVGADHRARQQAGLASGAGGGRRLMRRRIPRSTAACRSTLRTHGAAGSPLPTPHMPRWDQRH